MRTLALQIIKLISLIRYYKFTNGIKIFFDLLVKRKNTYVIKNSVFKNPIYLRNNESDPLIFEQIYSEQQYNFFHPFPEKVEWIIDAGANIGLAAIYFSQKFPNAKIISIEPNTDNYELLKRNTLNYSNVICLHAALWYREEHLDISNKLDKSASFRVQPGEDSSGNYIKAITIENLIKEYKMDKISILKIDIEGAEKEVFEFNNKGWISNTDCIIVELHDWLKRGTSQAFFKTMSEYNWRTYVKGENIISFKGGFFPDYINH